MAVSLTKYPVVSDSGKIRNIFAGFSAVELEFKREDIAVIDTTQGLDNKLLITVLGDITSELNVGEWIYVYSPTNILNYDGSFQVADIVFSSPNTEITVNTDFIEIGTGGYLNYKQNWFLESKLVSSSRTDILKYPSLLQSDGSPEGIVFVNTSMMVDFLKNEILENSGEVVSGREDCRVMWREVWREDETQAFNLVDESPIVVVFAAENNDIDIFLNNFEQPNIWAGYPFYLNFIHSVENSPGRRIVTTFDELDINQDNIITDNQLFSFEPVSFGFLQSNLADKVKEIEDNTRYIRFNANTSSSPDYQTGEYDDLEYLTENTP